MTDPTPRLYTKDLLDPETEIHYALHKSLQGITIAHRHEFYEIFLIVRGEVTHNVNGTTAILKEGSIAFIRPDDIHSYEKSGNKEVYLINVAFLRETCGELFSYLGPGFPSKELLESEYPAVIILPKSEKEIVQSRLEHLNTLPRTDKPLIRTSLRILLVEIFTKYFASTFRERNGNVPEWIDWLREEMSKKDNFTRGVTAMPKLALRSKEHISRLFRRHYSQTPTDFVNDLRLNYAANMLASSDEEIIQISMDSGFESLSHFYHLFKSKFGVSPQEFRYANHRKSIL